MTTKQYRKMLGMNLRIANSRVLAIQTLHSVSTAQS